MIEILEKAALSAGKVLMEYFSKGVSASYKTSHNDLLTEADTSSQNKIRQVILEAMIVAGVEKKKIGFLGEEKLSMQGEYQFIIDPLDGTNNFASGFNYFCVSIALSHKNSIISGVVYNPNEGVLYGAVKKKGAYKKKHGKALPLRARSVTLKDSLVSFILSKDYKIGKQQLQALSELQSKVRGIRSTHAAALDICHVAENIFQVSAHPSCSIWDIAAGSLILKEAGGTITDQIGNDIRYSFEDPNKKYSYIATNAENVQEIAKLLSVKK